MTFDLDRFVQQARQAAAAEPPGKAVMALMAETFADPQALARAIVTPPPEDVPLYEDDTVSVWWCRFDPAVEVPPHDHRITAYIGVYQGREINKLYRRGAEGLELVKTRTLEPGDVMALGPQGIHSVRPADGEACLGLHIYLGPLSKIERTLFDPESQAALPFTDENYERLTQAPLEAASSN